MEDEKLISQIAEKAQISKEQAKIALDTFRELKDSPAPGEVSEAMGTYFKIPSIMISRLDILNFSMNRGQSSQTFQELIALTKLPIKFLAEQVFEITPKTFAKYRDEQLEMPSRLSELAFKLKHLYRAGLEVFGSAKVFNEWLQQESFGLGGRKPADVLNISTGIDLVFEEVKRIEFGATA